MELVTVALSDLARAALGPINHSDHLIIRRAAHHRKVPVLAHPTEADDRDANRRVHAAFALPADRVARSFGPSSCSARRKSAEWPPTMESTNPPNRVCTP